MFADLFTTDIPCTNCLDAGLGDSAKTCTAIADGFDDEEQVQSDMHAPLICVWRLAKLSTTVSIYLKRLLPPLTWAVRTPSRYEVDSSLPKAIGASYIVVSACDTFPVCHFPGDCILLFKMPCQWVWVMVAETKLRKYIHVHNTAKLLQMKENALPLNIQMKGQSEIAYLPKFADLYVKLKRISDIQSNFIQIELLITSLAQILTELLQFKVLTYLELWWRHQRCNP